MSLFGSKGKTQPLYSERTAAQREAARQERERRRREREGAAPNGPPTGGFTAAEPAGPADVDPQQSVQRPPAPSATAEQPAVEPSQQLTDSHAATALDTAAHRLKDPRSGDAQQSAAQPPDPPAQSRHATTDPAVPTVAARQRFHLPRPRGSRPHRDSLLERRKARLREHRAASRAEHSGLTRGRIGALLALAAALALVWFLLSLFQPLHGRGNGSVIVLIPAHSSSSDIASILADHGVVSSGFFFELRALIEGRRSDLHSGRFKLQKDMSYSAAIAALSKPPPAQIPVRVLIPEGENRIQIAELASADELAGSYLQASVRSPLLDPVRYGAPRSTPDLEGFLFPATYDLLAGAPASRLVSEQLAAFREHFGSREIARARSLHVTPYQMLIIASMIEREAQVTADRPKIAAVIYNRLRTGMPLGIDATSYYQIEQQRHVGSYTGELTESELHSPSAYNTRTHRGLPPTPISNPGSASIQAAAHPAHAAYLYYVLAADGCGEHVFSSSAAQFERNATAYQQAVRKNGGKPPACKRK